MRELLLTSLMMCLTVIISGAQNADIKVSYDAYFQRRDNGKSDMKNQYILLANTSESKFYSPMTEYVDSLKATGGGKALIKNQTETAVRSGKPEAIPATDGSYYILKSFKDNNMRSFDYTGLEKFFYDEPTNSFEWEISDSTRNILGYECIKADANYHGRKWEAWFAPEIPIHNGPWKLNGLPGLILEAATEGGEYSFIATGLQQTSCPIGPVYNTDSYEKTDRISFLKAKRSYLDNPGGIMSAQFGFKMPKEVMEHMSEHDPSFDLIETDYH